MTPPAGRAGAALRLTQAAVFAAACVLLSAGGHALAAGSPVPWWALGVGWVAVFAAVAPGAGRPRTLPAITTGLAVGQLGLHLLFTTAAPAHRAGHSPGHGTPGGAGHAAGHAAAGPPEGGGHVSELVRAALSVCDPPMLLGHLLAALAAGWLLRRGQRALWLLLRLSAGVAERLAAQAAPLAALRTALACATALAFGRPAGVRPTTGHAARWRAAVAPRPAALRHAVVRRGPPPASRALAA